MRIITALKKYVDVRVMGASFIRKEKTNVLPIEAHVLSNYNKYISFFDLHHRIFWQNIDERRVEQGGSFDVNH